MFHRLFRVLIFVPQLILQVFLGTYCMQEMCIDPWQAVIAHCRLGPERWSGRWCPSQVRRHGTLG